MRRLLAAFFVLLGPASILAQTTPPCTGLCQQQVVCPNNGTTSISGVVYAPNGTDPLPNVTVYIPNAPLDPFTPGVSCPVVGAPQSGAPLVGTTTDFDGSFSLTNVPVGTNIPLVIVTGRWRRQVTVSTTTACADTAFSTRFPKNQTEGDIPKIAIASGAVDSVECVLRKVGIDDSEFTDPTGTGRINFYAGSYATGSKISATTPSEHVLMGTAANLNAYDVLMLPCEGGQQVRPAQELANFVNFANAGGRVYSSHYSYAWMYNNPPFNNVVAWAVNQGNLPDGIATVDTSFATGQTLSDWLQYVGASTTKGQIAVNTIRKDLNGVIKPTQSWLTLNSDKAVMQFVFDAPVGATTAQCGKVLFNEYHVESNSGAGQLFPTECSNGAMTPQEKLLEFSLFDLTSDGGAPTLTPPTGDFGNEAQGFTSAPISFTWTNNSSFGSAVNSATTTGPFNVVSNNCGAVAAGASCQISVVFAPTVLGAAAGKLTVASTGKTIYAALTGTGIPGLSLTPAAVDFGNVDVGAAATQTLTLSNVAQGSIPLPAFSVVGDYSFTTNCANPIPASSTCSVYVTFHPAATGARPGTLTGTSGYANLATLLTGNGVDFSISLSPTSGSVIAGLHTTTMATISSIAGFNGNINMSCTFSAPGADCAAVNLNFLLNGQVQTQIIFGTTAQYTVVGYGGFGSCWLALLAALSGAALWFKRRSAGKLVRVALFTLMMAAVGTSLTGCSGKLPAQNAVFTAPGPYTFTVTASDGTLSHSATFTLNVTAK